MSDKAGKTLSDIISEIISDLKHVFDPEDMTRDELIDRVRWLERDLQNQKDLLEQNRKFNRMHMDKLSVMREALEDIIEIGKRDGASVTERLLCDGARLALEKAESK